MASFTFDLEFAREEENFRSLSYSVKLKSERHVLGHLNKFGRFVSLGESRFYFCIVGLIFDVHVSV